MSEFKFACPVCGQHIGCDSSQSGTTLACPTCFQKVIVPQAPATADSKFILTGTKVSERPGPTVAGPDLAKPAPPKVSFLAPILFVLVLLVCIGLAMLFAHHGATFKPAAGGQPPKTSQAPGIPGQAGWRLNLSNVVYPDRTAAGRIHGQPFVSRRAILEGGTLTLRAPARGRTARGLSIYLYARRSADLIGQTIEISSSVTNGPRVRLRWLTDQGQPRTRDFKQGYALRMQLGPFTGKRMRGKIYLCLPDARHSYVAGIFNAEVRRPKPHH